MEAQPPFEQSSDSSSKDISSEYMILFLDHKEGDGIFINLRSILKMRIRRVEMSWTE